LPASARQPGGQATAPTLELVDENGTAVLYLGGGWRVADSERIADDVARAPDRMAQSQRRLLAGEAGGAGRRLVARQNVLLGLLVAARGQRGVELEHVIEMILDHALVAPGDEDEMFDAGFPGFVEDVLDQRLVDDGQHFLRHRLGGGQDAGAETGDREDGFADFHGEGRALKTGKKGNALIARW